MQVGLLGPLTVAVDGVEVTVAGARLRALLTRLAVDPGRAASVAELVEAVWGDEPPAEPAAALQSLVSRLRRALSQPGSVVQHPSGYLLAVGRGDLDATRFGDRLAAGRSALRRDEPAEAAVQLSEGLALWRGAALEDAGDAPYAQAYAARWEEQRLTARSELVGIALARGRAAEVVPELEELVVAHPLRESLTAQLMTALAASGRTAEALERYGQTRALLAEQLGTDPGPALQQLHLALLRGEPAAPAGTPDAGTGGRTNLRSWLTSFVGRADELDRVSELLRDGRLTTVVGPGGAGKTRLATEAARRWQQESGQPAWLVELAPVADRADIAPTILGVLGLRDARLLDRGSGPQLGDEERLLEALAGSRSLLVVDNCEHLVDPVARLVDEILARAPGVRVLATSREPLAITGESLCALPPLGLPDGSATLDEAQRSPAVRLWVDRARAVSSGFTLDEDTVGLVGEIVRRLDGLPLAIELAAARLRVLPLAEIASRLSDRFRLLTGGNRAGLPRHQTLRAVVEWSWALLDPAQRLLAERLAVFPAGATVETATAVCADDRLPADAISDGLTSLVDKSLLQSSSTLPVRYQMLETLREYGTERLTERGEVLAARSRHADHFAALAVELEPRLHDDRQLEALATLGSERDNVLAALRCYGETGRPADALRLGLALVWYWFLLGSNQECATWMRFVVRADEHRTQPQLAYAEAALALSEAAQGMDTVGLEAVHPTLLDGLRAAGEPPYAYLVVLAPVIAVFAGRLDLVPELVADVERSPSRWVRASVRAWAVSRAENDGDLTALRREADLALDEFTAIGDRWGIAAVLSSQAYLATVEGDLDRAVRCYERALRHVLELGSAEDDLYLQLRLAGVSLRQGDLDAARERLDALRTRNAGAAPARERVIMADAVRAGLLWQDGQHDAARELTGDLRRRMDESHLPAALRGRAFPMILATAAVVAADSGDAVTALADVTWAYPHAVASGDMPILGQLGVAVAHVCAARGQWVGAAEVLGAAAQIRGGDDPTDPQIRALVPRLVAQLGDGFDLAYARGRGSSRTDAVQRVDPARSDVPG